jgi:hypothetical protein
MTPQEMTVRLHRLERSQRMLIRASVITFALGAGMLLVGAGKATAEKTIEAQKVVIRDAKGVLRAALGTDAGGAAALDLFDAAGGKLISVRGAAGSPAIELADGAGGSAWLTVSATGSSLSLSKGNGEVDMATTATGAPSIRLQDRDGKVLWQAP